MKLSSWITPYIKENKKAITLAVLLGLLAAICAASLMFLSGYLISKSAARPENILLVYVPIVAVRAFSIFRAVFRYLERLAGHNVILKILADMRLRLYQAVEPKMLSLGKKFKTGDLLGVLADDIEHIQDVYLKTVFPFMIGVLLYLATIITFGVFSWPMALLMALYLFVIVFIMPALSLVVTRTNLTLAQQGRKSLYEVLTDAVLGLSDWMFSGRQEDFLHEYEARNEQLAALERRRRKFVRLRNFVSQLMVAGLVVLIVLWAAGANDQGYLPATLIAAFVLFAFPVTEVFLPLSEAVSQLPKHQGSLKRLEEIEKDRAAERVPAEGLPLAESDSVSLAVEDATFTYPSGKTALSGVSFNVGQGEKLVILGPSGSGKSTLVKLILGVISPSEGRVKLNGHDAAEMGDQFSDVISVLNQKPHLFDTSVLNNIRLGRPEASDEEVYEAAKKAKIHDLIESLPNGYRTQLHESGARFSGGERQRIALARILLQDNPIVILDEPAIGLDPKTEQELMKLVFESLSGKTILFITHHLFGINPEDRVLFIDHGKIAMDGTHASLLAENSRYRKLYESL